MYGFLVFTEYKRLNVYPRKSNFPSGIRQSRVFSSLTVNFSFDMMSRIVASAQGALFLQLDHQVISIIDDLCSKTRFKPKLLPAKNEPSHVQVRQQFNQI